jgi:hypothetical protein
MRKKILGLTLVLLLAQGLLTIALGATLARAATTQCRGAAIPTGELVTALYTSASCGNTSYNTQTLSPIARFAVKWPGNLRRYRYPGGIPRDERLQYGQLRYVHREWR